MGKSGNLRTSDPRAGGAVHDVFDAKTRQRIQGQFDISHFQRKINSSYCGSSEKMIFKIGQIRHAIESS